MSSLVEKILATHDALDEVLIPHAFGGALALAWCTGRARGTIDIDLNVFLDAEQVTRTFRALPQQVVWSDADVATAERDGQVRLWWSDTPVDIFMNTTEYHLEVAGRARVEDFAGSRIPFLGCGDLAVFKAFFSRTKDWADIEEMISARTLDVERVIGVLATYLGPDDERIRRLVSLTRFP